MQKAKKYLCCFVIVALAYNAAIAQTDSLNRLITDSNTASPVDTNASRVAILHPVADTFFIIKKIIFEGNKITRQPVMLREIPFKQGDSIEIKKIPDQFAEAKRRLMNMTLFHDVNVAIDHFEGQFLYVKVVLDEKWYLLPFPYFKPIDRNLNQWLFEKGASFSRVDYGVKLYYDNITGSNDKLRFHFITGYTKQLSLSYSRPYIDKAMKWGVNAYFEVGKNREILYNTINDKQQFIKNGIYMKNFFKSGLEFVYRNAIFTRHTFGIKYSSLRVADTVLQLNPTYFIHGSNSIKYPEVYYNLSYQNLDYIPYPTKGYAGEMTLLKRGFNSKMNLWQLSAKGLGNWHLGKKYFYSIMVGGIIKAPFRQPYGNIAFLGYGDMFLSGYEYYVIDGVAGGMAKATLSRQLVNFSLNIPFLKRFTGQGLIPLKVYGKVYGNTGYSYNPEPGNNSLSNKMLFGGGFGFDIYTTYDFTLKLEFSMNQLGQNGLFLHKKDIF